MSKLILITLFFLGFYCCKEKEIVEEYKPVQIPCNLTKNLTQQGYTFMECGNGWKKKGGQYVTSIG